MSGITDYTELMAGMSPELDSEEYVFCTLKAYSFDRIHELYPVAVVREPEGLTLIMEKARADAAHLKFDGVFRKITLRVHSSLQAVGLTAAFSSALASGNISANVVAGFYHDHIFVPASDAERAMEILQALSGSHQDNPVPTTG